MRPGEHAAEGDPSFARSTRGAALRGAALIVAAVLLGWALLGATEPSEAVRTAAPGAEDGMAGEDGGGLGVEVPPTMSPPSPGTTEGVPEGGASPPAPTSTVPPAEVSVLVANGTDVSGAAGRVSEQVGATGYEVLTPTDASEEAASSVVYFAPEFEAEARTLAEGLEPPPPVEPLPAPPPVSSVGEADVLLVLGPDLAADGG